MTFQRGFRNPIRRIGASAAAESTAVSVFIDEGIESAESVFTLSNSANLWRFYKLDFSMRMALQGHETSPLAHEVVVAMLIDDAETAFGEIWRAELELAAPTLEVRNIAIAGPGFDVPGGIAFPVGVDVKILFEKAVDPTDIWGSTIPNNWTAGVFCNILAIEVSP